MSLNTLGLMCCVSFICKMDVQQTISEGASQQVQLFVTPQARQRLVTAALDFVAGTALVPGDYEYMLLTKFVEGSLTIEQVLEHLEAA
jgi:hypothetical protein